MFRRHQFVFIGCSVVMQVMQMSIEVILVDNGIGSLLQHDRKFFGSFGLVEPGFNSGSSDARNVGAQSASAEHLIFLDDDEIADSSCVDALRCRNWRHRSAQKVEANHVP